MNQGREFEWGKSKMLSDFRKSGHRLAAIVDVSGAKNRRSHNAVSIT
jgi:phosphoribosylformimino-5-aminoimidazole carboxamide ribonucleotide (ProFAR) isomerase